MTCVQTSPTRFGRIASSLRAGMLAVLLALVMLPTAGLAQSVLNEQERAYLDTWRATATRAENAISAGRASTAALEALREEVVEYRRTFSNVRDDSTARLDTLQAQLDSLGPPPEEGQSEPSDIAELRAEIKRKIEELRVPVVVTRENFTRADGIIREIDRLVRDRQTDQLFTRTASPLNPAVWGEAASDALDGMRGIYNETLFNFQRKVEQKLLRQTLPLVATLTAIGLLLLLRGRVWAQRMVNYLRRFGGNGTGVWRFVASLGRIILPLIGVTFLVYAIVFSEILGMRGQLVLQELPKWAALLLGYRWLAERLYPKLDEDCIFGISAENRAVARRNLFAMAGMLVLFDALALFEDIENLPDISRAVLGFPVILATSLLLFRLRQVVRRESQRRQDAEGAGDGDDSPLGFFRFAPALRLITLIVAAGAPVMAAIGFGEVAEMALYAFVQTIGLYGLMLVLHRFLIDLYAWLSGKGVAAVEDSITPFLIGMVLVLVALPALALIWGARAVELAELWETFLEGVPIGETRITPMDFLTFIVVFIVGYTLTRMFQSALRNNLLPKTKIDVGGQNAMVSGTGYVGIFLAALLAVSMAGIDLSGLAIVAGALSVGIGFGLQNIVSNFVSGIILLIERPISEGDWVEVGGQMGYVRDISVRSTRIETFDRTDVIVPNLDFVSGQVTNFTRGNTVGRVIVKVGVAYGTDTRKVEAILRDVAESHPMVLAVPPPSVVFQGFGADALDFEIRAILRDVNWVMSVKSDMNHEIAARFAEAEIEIPFAQRDIWLRNPEALAANTAAAPSTAPREDPSASPETGPDEDGESDKT